MLCFRFNLQMNCLYSLLLVCVKSDERERAGGSSRSSMLSLSSFYIYHMDGTPKDFLTNCLSISPLVMALER